MTTDRLHQIIKLLRAELALIDKTIETLESTLAEQSRDRRPRKPAKTTAKREP